MICSGELFTRCCNDFRWQPIRASQCIFFIAEPCVEPDGGADGAISAAFACLGSHEPSFPHQPGLLGTNACFNR